MNKRLNNFIKQLKTVDRVEILPYHTLGEVKWEEMQIPYPLEGVRIPTPDEVKKAELLLDIHEKKYE